MNHTPQLWNGKAKDLTTQTDLQKRERDLHFSMRPSTPSVEVELTPQRLRPLHNVWASATTLIASASDILVRLASPAGTSTREDPSTEEECPICFSEQASFAVSCGHKLCNRCATTYVREALGDVRTHIHPAGIRCPMHPVGCTAFIDAIDASTLLDARDKGRLKEIMMHGEALPGQEAAGSGFAPWIRAIEAGFAQTVHTLTLQLRSFASRLAGDAASARRQRQPPTPTSPPPPEAHLTLDEVKRFQRFLLEAAIPTVSRTVCPLCKLLVLLPSKEILRAQSRRASSRTTTGRARALGALVWHALVGLAGRSPAPPRADVTCPHCLNEWDLLASAGDEAYDDRASRAYIRATSKECPNPACRQPISHFHGHACHHISPSSDGCPSCHTHFCFVCLRRHTRTGVGAYRRNHFCPHGSNFCNNNNIARHIVMRPYPHDSRCGCVICPHCRVGAPCAQCDGRCVVCTGVVAPGPSHLSADLVDEVLRPESSLLRWLFFACCSRRNPAVA